MKTSELVDIYVLKDPRDGAVRYVGKARDAKKRYASHMKDANRRDFPVYRWIRKLAAEGLQPALEVVEHTLDWRETEKELIAVLRARGERLLNVADGGDEPYCSLEVRQANGAKVAAARRADPVAYFLWHARKTLSTALRKGEVMNSTRAKLRRLAALRPDVFGAWADVPDRVET